MPIVILLVAGALALGQAVARATPGDDSAEAGFARDMSAHHEQAVQMAEIVRDRTADATIRALATEVVLVQQFQIGQIFGWLEQWGLSRTGDGPRMAWMGHPVDGISQMPGMAPREDVQRLADLPPAEMEAAFLRMMIPHHQGGVEMAEAALERTERPEVQNLARAIINTQKAEIEWMQTLLQRMGQQPVTGAATAPAGGASGHHETSGTAGTESSAAEGEGHGESGFATSFTADMRRVVRFAPLTLAVFAIAWLLLESLRRHDAQGIRFLSGGAGMWQGLVAGGLIVSAALHAGLTPEHFEEGAAYGVFFAGSTVVLAVLAAAALVRPSRSVYVAGALVAAVLVVLYALFRVIPPPGAEEAESINLTGLVTKAAELLAFVGCQRLWRGVGPDIEPAATQHGPRPRSPARRRRRTSRGGAAAAEG